MTVLVTGATGFTGRALVRHLANVGGQALVGMAGNRRPVPLQQDGVAFVRCDLLDAAWVRDMVLSIRPDRVIHLAGLNRGTPEELNQVNVTGTNNLLEAAYRADQVCRILVISSSAVYGFAGRKPIGEDTRLQPASAYGTSKAAMEQAALAFHASTGARIAIARPFNLTGPGQPDSFLCGQIVRQAVEIERGTRKKLDLLETSSHRDFIDVRDAVRAYWSLISHPDFERVCIGKAFNIGSGTTHAVSDVISLVEEITGRTYVVDMPEDPPIIPVPFQRADISRIRSITGWRPEISLKESLMDMIETARKVR